MAETPKPAPASKRAQGLATAQERSPSRGRVRALVAHEASGYKEWGASGAIRMTPDASGRGLTLSIAPQWGRTGSTTGQLWSVRDAAELERDSEFEATGQLAMDAGYGFGLGSRRGVLTPLCGHDARRWRQPHGARRRPLAAESRCGARVKGGEKPDQRAEQNTATAAFGGRWSEGVGMRPGAVVSRKRREGVARPQFPAGGDAQIRSSSPCFARGCG